MNPFHSMHSILLNGIDHAHQCAFTFKNFKNSKIQKFQGKMTGRLDPNVNRILFIRNLPYKLTTEDLYDLFGQYGSIRQIRQVLIISYTSHNQSRNCK